MINPLLSHTTYAQTLVRFMEKMQEPHEPIDWLTFYDFPRPTKSQIAYEGEQYILQKIKEEMEQQGQWDAFSLELLSSATRHQLWILFNGEPYAVLDGSSRTVIPLTSAHELKQRQFDYIAKTKQELSYIEKTIAQTEQKVETRRNRIKQAFRLPVRDVQRLVELKEKQRSHLALIQAATHGHAQWEEEHQQVSQLVEIVETFGLSMVHYDATLHMMEPYQNDAAAAFFQQHASFPIEGLLSRFPAFHRSALAFTDDTIWNPDIQKHSHKPSSLSLEAVQRIQRSNDCEPIALLTWGTSEENHLRFIDKKAMDKETEVQKVIFRCEKGFYTLCRNGWLFSTVSHQEQLLVHTEQEKEHLDTFMQEVIESFTN